MRRLWIAIAIVLMFSGQVWAAKQSNEIADITYLLRCWPTGYTVPDQSYTNGQVIDTDAEGCLDGSLTAHNTTVATMGMYSNIYRYTYMGSGSDSIEDLYVYSSDITSTLGIGVFYNRKKTYPNPTYCGSLTARLCVSGFLTNCVTSTSTACSPTALRVGGVYSFSISDDTYYSFASIIGGYDSSGTPYKVGDTKGNFTYGLSTYYKIPAGSWTLGYKNTTWTANPFSFGVKGGWNGSSVEYFKNVIIPNYDFSAILQPTHLSTFTAADGTALGDYTPDVGGAWSGTDTIVSNTFGLPITGGNKASIVDVGISTNYVQARVRYQDDADNRIGYPNIQIRYVDDLNRFIVRVLSYDAHDSGEFSIRENDGGASVSRASTYTSVLAKNTYGTITIVNSSSAINAYLSSGATVSYSSSSKNTSTNVGMMLDSDVSGGNLSNEVNIDNFAVWPLTSATYTSEFAKVGY